MSMYGARFADWDPSVEDIVFQIIPRGSEFPGTIGP
jgi:hypothetical protein